MVTLLGPDTVALAVPLFKSQQVLMAHTLPALVGIAAGTACALLVALGMAAVGTSVLLPSLLQWVL
jgi:putative effector of murein hydrolase